MTLNFNDLLLIKNNKFEVYLEYIDKLVSDKKKISYIMKW